MKKKKHRSIPKFKSYQEEKAYWESHDVSDYIDLSLQNRLRYEKNLNQQITIRLASEDLTDLKRLAFKHKKSLAAFIRLKIVDYLDKHRQLIKPKVE